MTNQPVPFPENLPFGMYDRVELTNGYLSVFCIQNSLRVKVVYWPNKDIWYIQDLTQDKSPVDEYLFMNTSISMIKMCTKIQALLNPEVTKRSAEIEAVYSKHKKAKLLIAFKELFEKSTPSGIDCFYSPATSNTVPSVKISCPEINQKTVSVLICEGNFQANTYDIGKNTHSWVFKENKLVNMKNSILFYLLELDHPNHD